jgi:hypothetical protein
MTTSHDPCPELTETQRALKTDQWPILDLFSQSLPDFPEGEAIDCDTPDFIIDTGEMKLGIDVISLRPAANAEDLRTDVFRNVVIRAAKEIFEDDIELPILVQLAEKPLLRTTDDFIEPAAVSLTRMVRANVPLAPGETREVAYWKFIGTPLLQITDRLAVSRLPDGEPARWMFMRNFAYGVDVPEIERALTAKNGKAVACRQRCDAVWLVIGAGYEHIASELMLPDDLALHRFDSAFDRTFVFDCFGGGYVELNKPLTPAKKRRTGRRLKKNVDASANPRSS